MSKFLVYVMIPYTAGASNISDYADKLLMPYAMSNDSSSGWYDYLVGNMQPVFNDPTAERELPDRQKRSLHRHVCYVSHLVLALEPFALITPDGIWHACEPNYFDYCTERERPKAEYWRDRSIALETWTSRYKELLAIHPHCWVVAIWAHS